MTTVIVLITDNNYKSRALRTIKDVRTVGKWKKDIVLITIDFSLEKEILEQYNIIEKQFELIDKSELINKIGKGYANSDRRELCKLNQWEKIHVFDEYFKKWKKVIYLDSGLRILDDMKYFDELECTNCIIAPNDKGYYPQEKPFKCQLEMCRENEIQKLCNEFGKEFLEKDYFLNCIWIYDTLILDKIHKKEMIEYMNKYPIWRTNEMGVMNLLFTFKYKCWKEMPLHASNKKYLFEWCEANHPFYTNWTQYCAIKYPLSIHMGQDPIF